ncbi:MAG: hypothetical protein H7Z74_08670 [Anaerolineae bacterium]|nr:hypothetical protein [Gemmatimonadaceae bacterium]
MELALSQSADGVWNHAILTVPSARGDRFHGVGTINAVRRLVEYGWDRESPPLLRARRIMFRLLAEDDDPAYAFELTPRRGADPGAGRRARTILREAAAATLAQAGYEKDPRLRGAAARIGARLLTFLSSPIAADPLVRTGNQWVLRPDASPPSIYTLIMLAYMPLFRNERYEVIGRLADYLAAPAPRSAPAVATGKDPVLMPHLVMGNPLPSMFAAEADIPWALTWLELAARLGILRKNEGWMSIFDRFLDSRDERGVWHPRKNPVAPRSTNPYAWPNFPLEPSLTGEARWTDVTFRLGLIARLLGRQVNLI